MKSTISWKGDGCALAVLTLDAADAAEVDSLIASTFSRCAALRAALLIRAERVNYLETVVRALHEGMLQPAVQRPAAVSLVVRSSRIHEARELSLNLAHACLGLGSFTDAARAEVHALRERALVVSEESSSSIVMSVTSSSRYVFSLRAGLNWSKRSANDSARSESRNVCDA